MKRRFFNAGALASLCLFVLIAALWVRGLFYYDEISSETWRENGTAGEVWNHCIRPGGGVLWIERLHRRQPFTFVEDRESFLSVRARPRPISHHARPARGWWFEQPRWYGMPTTTLWRRLGFFYEHRRLDSGATTDGLIMAVPLWLLMLGCVILPAAWWRSGRLRRRAARGLCSRCGYDLRGTPSGAAPGTSAPGSGSKTCPEYGAADFSGRETNSA